MKSFENAFYLNIIEINGIFFGEKNTRLKKEKKKNNKPDHGLA